MVNNNNSARPFESTTAWTFEVLIAIGDLNNRLTIFDALPEKERLCILYPAMETTGLPNKDPYPENWGGMLNRATEVVKKKIQDRFPKKQKPAHANNAVVNTDSELYESMRVEYHNGISTTNSSQISNEEMGQLSFLKNLPRCLPMKWLVTIDRLEVVLALS
jgi:hypothetical protein